jgi:hypothetical protein
MVSGALAEVEKVEKNYAFFISNKEHVPKVI